MIVLDASAVIALVKNEPGAERVATSLHSSAMGTANWCEVAGKLIDAGKPIDTTLNLLESADVTFEDVTLLDAQLAATLRQHSWARHLSLGDRLCLALAHRLGATVLTSDRAWESVDLPGVQIELLR